LINLTSESKPQIVSINFASGLFKDYKVDVLLDEFSYPTIGNNTEIIKKLNGNKWRKLKFNISEFKRSNKEGILSFGGAFSNHLYALAAAGKIFDFKTIGIVRGEIPKPLNPTLKFCKENGMKLIAWDRNKYRQKNEVHIKNELTNNFKNFEIIEEGGTNNLAIKGVSEIWNYIKIKYDYIITPIGTAGTFCGVIIGSNGKSKIIGVPVLKMNFEKSVNSYLSQFNYNHKNYLINYNYHFGGYAKWNSELIDFINEFYTHHQIQLDPVYNAKSFFAVFDMLVNEDLNSESKILIIHTGGAQGIKGFNERFKNLKF